MTAMAVTEDKGLKIVSISDTHTFHRDIKEVPSGDVLIFAGDLMGSGYKHVEVIDFAKWFSEQPHQHKILIAGNHDRLFESNRTWCLSQFDKDVIYLQDDWVELEDFKFYGSPWQPYFYNWAFNLPRGKALEEKWDLIPTDTDVLITHGPPYGILDQIIPPWKKGGDSPFNQHLGCEELLKAVYRVKPRLHVFGHIHGSSGTMPGSDYDKELSEVAFGNVSICDESYKPVNSMHTHWFANFFAKKNYKKWKTDGYSFTV